MLVRFIISVCQKRKHAAHYSREEGLQCPTRARQQKYKKGLLDSIKRILAGCKTQPKTLLKYGWTLTQVNRIRALDLRFKAVLEDSHNVNLDSVFTGTALPPLNALAANVQERPAPAPPPVPKYEQGLVETPAKGTGTPISWRQIDTFWAGDVDKHEMGSNAVRKVMKDGQLAAAKYKRILPEPPSGQPSIRSELTSRLHGTTMPSRF